MICAIDSDDRLHAASAGPVDRVRQTLLLDASVSEVRFVNTTRLRGLAKLGITRVRDLLQNYPHRYNDLSQVSTIAATHIGEKVSVVGTVDEVTVKKVRARMTIVEISLLDDSGVLMATWFNQPWMATNLRKGMKVLFFGKVEHSYGFKRMSSPLYTILSADGEFSDEPSGDGQGGGILPVHPATGEVSVQWMARLVREALAVTDAVLDPLPAALRVRHDLMSRHAALKTIHFPKTIEQKNEAHRRLAYEEILQLQLYFMLRKQRMDEGTSPRIHRVDGPALARLRAAIPFVLTGDQDTAVATILSDMAHPVFMNRLLLGDVGSGKTIVAALALAAVYDSGSQAAMMAPTEVLADQYALKVGPLLDEADIPWALLTSSTTRSEREAILKRLRSGEVALLFGTHALIEDDVIFNDLSLVVIDEQHRFGVDQRRKLQGKGVGCDVLAMTATPIPRSLALTLYGDMECTYLRNRPLGRAKTVTKVLAKRDRGIAYDAIRAAVSAGHQAYIICPLITDAKSEVGKKKPTTSDEGVAPRLFTEFDDVEGGENIKAVEREVSYLKAKVFPEYRLGLLTGRLPAGEKRAIMEAFRLGEIDVLVSTTVVEVGVDVPNATVMIIEDAERFGLSQLHQLRGRVGRGVSDAQVFLLASTPTDESKARMRAMETTDDGFTLSEYDLSLRHEGDVLGSRQHGAATLRLVNVVRDAALISRAHDDARTLLRDDPELAHPAHQFLASELSTVFAQYEEAE